MDGGVISCIFTNETRIGLERFFKVHALPESLPAFFLTFPVSVGPRCSNSALWCSDFRVSLSRTCLKRTRRPVSASAALLSLYQQFREIGSASTLGGEPPTWRLYSAHTFLRCRERSSVVFLLPQCFSGAAGREGRGSFSGVNLLQIWGEMCSPLTGREKKPWLWQFY